MGASRHFIAAHIIVRGVVQGVGFRDWTCMTAKSLKLRGFVRNLPDETVEVLIEGPESEVDKMIHQLRKGPRRAQVDHLEVVRGHASGEFSNFSIER